MKQDEQITYIQKLNKELFRDITQLDMKLTAQLKRNFRQKKAFQLLVELQQEIANAKNNEEFFRTTAGLINATLEMNATYIYKPLNDDVSELEVINYHMANKNKEKFVTNIDRISCRSLHDIEDYIILKKTTPANNPFDHLRKLFNLNNLLICPVRYNKEISYVIITGLHYVDYVIASPIEEEDARAIEAVGILISSYLRKAELIKLYETDKIKTEFISNLSHEFRTPLTLALGLLEDLGKKYDNTLSNEDAVSFDIVMKNAQRIRELIDQLLDISKLETETETLAVIPASLDGFVSRITNSFSSLAQKKKIDFRYAFDSSSQETWFDEDKLEKIITNLLSNAFKFTPRGASA